MGTPQELNQFLATVEKRAYAMTLVSVRNSDDALDIVQDAMLTLADKYARKTPDQWTPLFYRVLRNRITDFHRAKKVRSRFMVWRNDSAAESEQQDLVDAASAPGVYEPERLVRVDGIRTELIDALAQLPARQREAFLFRVWEGMDVKNTAKAMGCSQGSVKTHFSRAVHTLRDQLEDFYDGH